MFPQEKAKTLIRNNVDFIKRKRQHCRVGKLIRIE